MANFEFTEPPQRPRPLPRDWVVFGLTAACMVLAGVSICLTIAVVRRYTPRVVIKEVTKEVVVERPIVVPDSHQEPIALKAADLVTRMMQRRGFLIFHQDAKFILLVERENTKRVYVAIDQTADGLIERAEVSILVRDAADKSSTIHYLSDALEFSLFFGNKNEDTLANIVRVMTSVADGVIDSESFETPHCGMKFARGPRDYRDAFIFVARPLG